MLFAKDHIGKGGIHPAGWNADWAEWVEKQKAAGKPINAETMKAQLEKMKASPTYAAAFKSGYPAEKSYAEWGKYLEEKAAKKAAKGAGGGSNHLVEVKDQGGTAPKRYVFDGPDIRAKQAEKAGPTKKVFKWIGKRVPYLGIGVSAYFYGEDVEAKGAVGGTANSALDAIPYGGFGKGVIELFTGDWIPDKDPNSPPDYPLIPNLVLV